MNPSLVTASLVLAAGRGSRMQGFSGNKTLLPLEPAATPFQGRSPLLCHILVHLPSGPKAIVVHHCKEDVMRTTRDFGVVYCEQPTLNGTGGALLAARPFLVQSAWDVLLITMGDVPLLRPETCRRLLAGLEHNHLVVLGFKPTAKKRYGVLDFAGEQVRGIIEWQYWNRMPAEDQRRLTVCNAGIYAVRRADLLAYLPVLAAHPHTVQKRIDGVPVEVKEFFLTDLVAYLHRDGLPVGCVLAGDADEVMGIDDLESLQRAQDLFRARQAPRSVA